MPVSYSSYIPKLSRNALRENNLLKTMQENSANHKLSLSSLMTLDKAISYQWNTCEGYLLRNLHQIPSRLEVFDRAIA